MIKQKRILFFSLSLLSFSLSAQTLSPSAISAGGSYASSGSGSLSATIGEMSAVSTLSSGSSILTQGFQQANIAQGNSILDLESNAQGSMIIYPNPADKSFTIGYKFPTVGMVNVKLYDVQGNVVSPLIEETYINGNAVYNYDCSKLAAGTYSVGLSFASSGDKSHISLQKQLIIVK